jgi:hypothetical protein
MMGLWCLQPCTDCWNDAQSSTGSCLEDCPSGELQPLALLSEQQRRDYVFTHFAGVDLFPSEVGVTRQDLGRPYASLPHALASSCLPVCLSLQPAHTLLAWLCRLRRRAGTWLRSGLGCSRSL